MGYLNLEYERKETGNAGRTDTDGDGVVGARRGDEADWAQEKQIPGGSRRSNRLFQLPVFGRMAALAGVMADMDGNIVQVVIP